MVRMKRTLPAERAYTLAEVVTATGCSSEVLRAWERRYGFPQPVRVSGGRRLFPEAQLKRLRLVRQLLDHGARPAHVVGLPLEDLLARASGLQREEDACGLDAAVMAAFDLAARCDDVGLADHLAATLTRRGALRFVFEIAIPLVVLTGESWHSGRIAVHHERLVTHALLRLLGNAAADLHRGSRADAGRPIVILATCPGEAHYLGLAMLEVVAAAHGARCISLGTELPGSEIAEAAVRHGADVVALSFSTFFRPGKVGATLDELRRLLPERIAMWVGGGCAGLDQGLPPGVARFTTLDRVESALIALPAARGAL